MKFHRFAPVLWFLPLLMVACSNEPGYMRLSPDVREMISDSNGRVAPGTFVDAHAIIIIRHADIDSAKKSSMGNATPLLNRGEKRAKELITALKSAGVTRIITSSAVRTQETAAPLAAELHIKPEDPFSHGAEGAAANTARIPEAQAVHDYLANTAKPDQTILVVHHHSVIPDILASFGFPKESHMDDESEFDRVYVLLPGADHKSYQLLRLRYGGKWD